MTSFDNLRAANTVRQLEWDPSSQITGLYRAVELAGEVGELANVVKKLERERLGLPGSRESVEHLAEELADVFICIDLLAAGYRLVGFFEEDRADISTFPWDALYGVGKLVGAVGAATESVTSNDDGENPHKINLGMFFEKLREANMWAKFIAFKYGVDPKQAVVVKFNATSEKIGLETRLAY